MAKLPRPFNSAYRLRWSAPSLPIPITSSTRMRNLSPVISPSLSLPPPSPLFHQRRLSVNSIYSLASSSAISVLFPEADAEVVTAEGLRHVNQKLEARRYKTLQFAFDLLHVIKSLQVYSWTNVEITPEALRIQKVSGSMTNAVFFVSCLSIPHTRTLLLRIYGPSSGSLISRPRELHTLHILSSRYRIGPRVFGTFENGRVEEYFESTTLTADDLRNPIISRWIGARMAELHSVDIEVVEQTSHGNRGEGKEWEIGVKKNIRSWLKVAHEVFALPAVSEAYKKEFDLQRFEEEWQRYLSWLASVDDICAGSKRVFAHNDTQYGNLLRLASLKDGVPEHQQIIVVDFEYASPNPASFDIANYFHEWTANYHSSTPHNIDPSRYPSFEQRRNFYSAYLEHSMMLGNPLIVPKASREEEIAKLDKQVRAWNPASHAMWAVWGIVQAKEDLENDVKEPEFDYLGYAKSRLSGFRRELQDLRISP